MAKHNEERLLTYYYNQEDYERRPSTSSTSSSTSSKRSSSHLVSSMRHSFRLSSLFTLRRFTRYSLPALLDDPLSPKQMEIEQLIAADPERTVRFSITPDFAI